MIEHRVHDDRLLGIAALTLPLASLFFIEGILVTGYFQKRRRGRCLAWLLPDGIVMLLLGLVLGCIGLRVPHIRLEILIGTGRGQGWLTISFALRRLAVSAA